MARQFLIIQTAFLGDAVLVTSIVEKLHAWYPDAAIDLVVRKGNEGLFGMDTPARDGLPHAHPFLRRVHVWDKRKAKIRRLFALIRRLRRERYDHIINAQRFFSTGLMTLLARGQERVGYDKNPLSFLFTRRMPHVIGGSSAPFVHEVDRLNALIAHLTDGTRPLPRLHPTESAMAEVRSLMATLGSTLAPVVIAPASVWYTKQWPAHKWVELIKGLPSGTPVCLIGAPGDAVLCERIVQAAGRGHVLAGRLSLLGTAALMEQAAMNYVNDSAPLHIASAMRAPVTAVFCSTVPAFGFGPLHANGRIAEIDHPLPCRPCGLHGYARCPLGHFKCAEEIAVAAVR